MDQQQQDQKELEILLSQIRNVYPSAQGKTVAEVDQMVDQDVVGSWPPYREKIARLQPVKVLETWKSLADKINAAFTGHFVRDVTAPEFPSLRLSIAGPKSGQEIILNRSLVADAVGFLYKNDEISPSLPNIKPFSSNLNNYSVQVSFEPNFTEAAMYADKLSALARSVYPETIILKSHLALLKVEGILYPGSSSIGNPAETILFFALFDE